MSGDTGPTLTPNTMTIIEIEGDALDDLKHALTTRPYRLRVALEVEPDGATTYVKFKLDEATWSLPYTASASARVERLY